MPCHMMPQEDNFKIEMRKAENKVKNYLEKNLNRYTIDNRLPMKDMATDLHEPLERTMHAVDHLIERGELNATAALLISGKHPRPLKNLEEYIGVQDIPQAKNIEQIAIPAGMPFEREPSKIPQTEYVNGVPTPTRGGWIPDEILEPMPQRMREIVSTAVGVTTNYDGSTGTTTYTWTLPDGQQFVTPRRRVIRTSIKSFRSYPPSTMPQD